MAIGSGDYPYSGAAMAKILMTVLENDGRIGDFFKKFDEDEEELLDPNAPEPDLD